MVAGTTMSNVWSELAKVAHVAMRMNRGRASIRLWAICQHSPNTVHLASFTARQREAEDVEAMLWRALSEFRKREIEGNPKPRPEEAERRKQRRMLRDAPETRPM